MTEVQVNHDVFHLAHETSLTPKWFLSRSLTRKARELLKRGKRNSEVADIVDDNSNSITSSIFLASSKK